MQTSVVKSDQVIPDGANVEIANMAIAWAIVDKYYIANPNIHSRSLDDFIASYLRAKKALDEGEPPKKE